LNVKDAMTPGAVKVHEDIPDIDGIPNVFNKRPIKKGNDPKEDLDKAPCS